MLCSYNIDNADSIEGCSVRLKSCLYDEETASTCSVFASRSTLSLLQPAKLGTMPPSQQSDTQCRGSDGRRLADVAESHHDTSLSLLQPAKLGTMPPSLQSDTQCHGSDGRRLADVAESHHHTSVNKTKTSDTVRRRYRHRSINKCKKTAV